MCVCVVVGERDIERKRERERQIDKERGKERDCVCLHIFTFFTKSDIMAPKTIFEPAQLWQVQ